MDNNIREKSIEDPPEIYLRVTNDRMAVLLDCDVTIDNLEPLVDVTLDELSHLNLQSPPDRAQLKEQLRGELEKDPHLVDIVLIQGTPLIQPIDGRIEWAGDFFNTSFVVDEETGKIDYRRRTGESSIKEGDLLACIIPSVKGRDGRDVFGKKISMPPGKRPRIHAGENVRRDEEGNAFYARASGRIRWMNNVVSVDRVYTVRGNVGLETGNISHPGALVVMKDVQEGSKIDVGGDIEVHGIIEAADIKAGGNLTVRGGIIGDNEHRIEVKGSIHAKFILDADVQAEGDIVVESEIVHSFLKTHGAVTITRGRIVGGEVIALGGIEAGQAGTSASIPTQLIAGEDYSRREEIKEKRKAIYQEEKNLMGLRSALQSLASSKEPEKKEEIESEDIAY